MVAALRPPVPRGNLCSDSPAQFLILSSLVPPGLAIHWKSGSYHLLTTVPPPHESARGRRLCGLWCRALFRLWPTNAGVVRSK